MKHRLLIGACKCGAGVYRPPKFMGRRMAKRCDDCERIVGRCTCRIALTVHACPEGFDGRLPCCGRTVFEALMDRTTLDPRRVTCGRVP